MKFTERRLCLACGRYFTVDLMKGWMVKRLMCSDKCRREAHLEYKRETYGVLNPRPDVPFIDIHKLSHEERVEYYSKRYASGLDPLTGRRLSKTQRNHCIAVDIRSHNTI